MLTIRIWLIELRKLTEKITDLKHRSKMWRKHALVSVSVMVLCIATVVFVTGVLYYKNDVSIIQNGESKTYFTMKEETGEILSEFGYSAGEFDRIVVTTDRNHKFIEIVPGYGIEISADGVSFMGSAVEGESPQIILTANSIEVGRHDTIVYDNDKMDKVEILRGFGVDVTADNQTVTVSSLGEIIGETVGDILDRSGITLGENDIINIPLDESVRAGYEIVINRVVFRERGEVEPIPYETSHQYSNLVAIGETRITDGVDGEIETVYLEKLVDGTVTDSEVLSKTRTKSPETEVIVHGKALKTPYSKRDFPEIKLENGVPVDYERKISGKSTAYTAPNTAGTASGRKLEIGTVAVDPAKIPYGSLLYIVTQNGSRVYGAAVAADTGGFILYGDMVVVDVFMGYTENYNEAVRWGGQMVDVYVINTGVY
ncbi:MAG: 3D domain-containing protein [Oscillospiraceae bacterium]|nr:3D domain-containing protein [Oscillospiraceae bacterium]